MLSLFSFAYGSAGADALHINPHRVAIPLLSEAMLTWVTMVSGKLFLHPEPTLATLETRGQAQDREMPMVLVSPSMMKAKRILPLAVACTSILLKEVVAPDLDSRLSLRLMKRMN